MLSRRIKFSYIVTCLCLSVFLSGCKEKGGKITAFDNLPDSVLVSQVKASLEDKKPIVISFTAEWCPHCREYKPIFSDVKNLFTNKVTFINVDVDDSSISAIVSRFQVRGIPTTVFIRQDGSVFKVQVGEFDKETLKNITNELIASKKKKKDEPVAPFPLDEQQQDTGEAEQKETIDEIPSSEPDTTEESPNEVEQEEVKQKEIAPESTESLQQKPETDSVQEETDSQEADEVDESQE